jgi:tetratricopeptide (TPR) repeat protein
MSKKEKSVGLHTEKLLANLMKEISKQGFKTEGDINDFMSQIMGHSLDELPKNTDNKSRSQDLVYDAYDQSATQGRKLVKQALELDPNNAEAYNYLASIESDIDKAIQFYENAIKAGEKSLGKKFLKEQKGHFWLMIETRPYMRALAGLAGCFYAKKEIDKAIQIYQEMLDLNPNDNQGIRYLLSTLLLSKNDLVGFEQLMNNSEEEDTAVCNYNNALWSFKKTGRSANSNKLLLKAFKDNRFVVDYMLGIKKMPKVLPQYIGIGDENEGIVYANANWAVWDKTHEALDWLYETKQKRLKKN